MCHLFNFSSVDVVIQAIFVPTGDIVFQADNSRFFEIGCQKFGSTDRIFSKSDPAPET